MLKLRDVFSDHALFLHSSTLTIYGESEPDRTIRAELLRNGEIFSSDADKSDENGGFHLTLKTPTASFDTYEITVSNGVDKVTIRDILFGELWLASGQSNMEMYNWQQKEFKHDIFNKLQGKNIRVFRVRRETLVNTNDYPIEPDTSLAGLWITTDMYDELRVVSACATSFTIGLYEFLNKNANIPIGFVNINKGASLIEPWLPKFAWEGNEELETYLKDIKRYPDPSEWNTKGDQNFNQTGALFNLMVAPVLGIKLRGIIWYQGEGNCGTEYRYRIYAKLMKALRTSYKELFSNENEIFPILSSQLYPWMYGGNDETNLGYLNKAFSDLAKAEPEKYPFIPICDLPPIWGAHIENHPIHPTHKYRLGYRMALMCQNSVYGRKIANVQKLPAMLKSCVRHGSCLRLTFSNVGSGLYIKNGAHVRGLYICDDRNIYVPAYCEIINRSAMVVSGIGIEKPTHVAYAVASQEVECNLFAGEFPVAPFATDMEPGTARITISQKPWLRTDLDSEFIIEDTAQPNPNSFRHPIYRPLENSSVCFDPDFALSSRAIRIWDESKFGEEFGAYVLAKHYNSLDLYNYKKLSMAVFNHKNTRVRLALSYAEKDGVEKKVYINGTKQDDINETGWAWFDFDLTHLDKACITKMELLFNIEIDKKKTGTIDNIYHRQRTVCIDMIGISL